MFRVCRQKGVNMSLAMMVNYAAGTLTGMCQLLLNKQSVPSLCGEDCAAPLILAFFIGFLYVTGFVVRDSCTRKCGVALTTVSARAALLVPTTLSWMFLGEKHPVWLAVVLVMVSLVLMAGPQCRPDGRTSAGIRTDLFIPLVGLFLIYGFCDFSLKLVQHLADGAVSHYLVTMVVFGSAFITSLFICVRKDVLKCGDFTWRELLSGSVIGLANSMCTVMVLNTLSQMPATVFYALYNVCVVAVCTLTGVFIFKERLSWCHLLGIVSATAAIALVLFS